MNAPIARTLRAPVAALAMLGAAACHGPAIRLENPDRHAAYLDGVREWRAYIPFRFYGTSRLDVVPADRNGWPDWEHRATTTALVLEPPASPWLFPFDFLGEVWHYAWNGPGDLVAKVEIPEIPPGERITPPVRPPGIDGVNLRAYAARTER